MTDTPKQAALRQSILSRSESDAAYQDSANAALDKIYSGIAELTALGTQTHLVLGPSREPAEWPKMRYHDRFAPQGQVFTSQEEIDDEKNWPGDGWRDHPAAAPAEVEAKTDKPVEVVDKPVVAPVAPKPVVVPPAPAAVPPPKP